MADNGLRNAPGRWARAISGSHETYEIEYETT